MTEGKDIATRVVQTNVALREATDRLQTALDALLAGEKGAAQEVRSARKDVDEASKDLKAAVKAWRRAAGEK